ncbi:MAG: pyridoxal phosphate-dependent aminotransferase family protein, partial [Gemmatimonadota bacterium]
MSTESLAGYTRDPFDGFFDGRPVDELVEAGSLLDTEGVRQWFELFHRGLPHSLYTYQLPLSRAPGPESAALDEDFVMFSSYSYLGLIGDDRIRGPVQEAVERYGTSTGGVRLLTGTLDLHHELETELADFLDVEAASVFSSGYDANVGVITSLFGPGDWAVLDQYAHRSIQDGCRMAGCEIRPFRHNDLEDLERRLRQADHKGIKRVLVAVDGVFSMDGDQAPLAEIIALKEKYGAFLLVDEAHSLGSIGETGRGTCEAQGIDPARVDLLTGSLSKGIPSSGGFVAGGKALKIYVQHGSSPYIFSAALTPANAAAALAGIRTLRQDPSIMARLRENTVRLQEGVLERGLVAGRSESPVVPL